MFVPKIAKSQTKTAADSISLVRPRSTLAAQRHSPAERAPLLQRTIGNHATLRLLSPLARNLAENEPDGHNDQNADPASAATPGASWSFSKIPLFSSDRARQVYSRPPLAAPQLPDSLQRKLAVGQVNDPLEQEADRVADQVMRMPAPDTTISAAPPRISRKCAECEEEEKLQKKETEAAEPAASEAPPIVYDVLRSPGQPLDAQTRAFMEPRFGYDFGCVRVHTDHRAAASARAVNALAYTVGSDVVFQSTHGLHNSSAGRELLAHELAHVVQQGQAGPGGGPLRISHPTDREEIGAEQTAQSALTGGMPRERNSSPRTPPTLSRRIIPRLVHCTPSTDGAPGDPVAELTVIVDRAQQMATIASILLKFAAARVRAGLGAPDAIDQDFNDHFAAPPAVSGGFLNRLTGAVRPTLDIALSEEMELMAGRLTRIANTLASDFNHYLCIAGATSWGGCNIPDCSRDAWACPNVNAYFLCPGFWGDAPASSILLIHETAHMIWERVIHGAEGSGGNFRHAQCYAEFVADLFQVPFRMPPGEECVPPP